MKLDRWKCDVCGKEVTNRGVFVFWPIGDEDRQGQHAKIDVCSNCCSKKGFGPGCLMTQCLVELLGGPAF